MLKENLNQFIIQGLDNGRSLTELKVEALELGIESQDFDHAYDRVILGETSEPIKVPEFKSSPMQNIIADPMSGDAINTTQGIEAQQPEYIPSSSPKTNSSIAVPLIPKSPQQVASTQIVEPATTMEITTLPHDSANGGIWKWFKVHKLAVACLVAVCLLGGGGWVAANMLIAPNVNEVRGLIFDKLQEMDTVVYQGSVEGEISTDAAVSLESILKNHPNDTIAKISEGRVAGSQNTKIRMDFNGALDARDLNSPKSEFSFTVTADGFVVGLETKSINDDLFLKLTQLPDFGIKEINDLMNHWLKIDYQQIMEQVGEQDEAREESLTLEQKQRLIDVFKNSNVFKMAERIGSEQVDGKATHHYRYTLDEDGLLAMAAQLGEVFGTQEPLTAQEKEEFKDWLDTAGGEIWIEKKDYAPVKMTFELLMTSVSDAPVSGKLSFELKFNKYNEEVAIEAPYPFKDLADILEEYKKSASVLTRDARRLSDIHQIMTALELYFNDYGSYPRTLDQLTTAENPVLLAVPFAPQPPDGKCTAVNNEYIYKLTNNNKDYSLTFCTGEDTTIYKAGVHSASSMGIK